MKQLREAWSWPTVAAPLVFGLALVLVVTSCGQTENPVAPSAAPNQLAASTVKQQQRQRQRQRRAPTRRRRPHQRRRRAPTRRRRPHRRRRPQRRRRPHQRRRPHRRRRRRRPHTDANSNANADARLTGLHTRLLEAGPALRFISCGLRARPAVRPVLRQRIPRDDVGPSVEQWRRWTGRSRSSCGRRPAELGTRRPELPDDHGTGHCGVQCRICQRRLRDAEGHLRALQQLGCP